MFALQTPRPVKQLEEKERENRKAQLGIWIKTELIRGSAKDRPMPFVCVCVCNPKQCQTNKAKIGKIIEHEQVLPSKLTH